MMRAASRQAQLALQEQIDETAEKRTLLMRPSADTLMSLAGELHSVGSLLATQPRLRRTLGDPATNPDARARLADQLFAGRIGENTMNIVRAAVRARWSSPFDMTDGIENAGDEMVFAAAERDGVLDQVEDELFRFERILETHGDVTGLLDEQTVDVNRRYQLLDGLVGGKVSSFTMALLRHAVASERKRSITLAIDDLLERAAARRERSVAQVMSAVPLTAEQESRLAAALTEIYGRPVSIRTALDPSLRGGLVVRMGDEVIDGSIATRFELARTQIAG